jgi:hypothetical protein
VFRPRSDKSSIIRCVAKAMTAVPLSLTGKVSRMLISSISRVGARNAQASRSASPRASRPPTSAPTSSSAGPAQTEADDGDLDDPYVRGQQLGMTLAAAQAAYASN